ncbi:LLM class flavin-dependent oxidoreductase [Paenibacillus eucommiae]|uniref:FMN-dependent oxidoreductase (Nitrilotriacetate monooxygenase family) n=1 Tax=Paenibacillus eucommiae TaxID=1355755 RepID=A0ABS4J938_9BACL|nr:LLM class flavin-dependent oxidoreductase [Paenibacillus eucommiae]MBP1996368.1 FMN-dependent oxidoreductase (nitrilotriacetate monooxygenase family) [Paenibacillus eucommiae]
MGKRIKLNAVEVACPMQDNPGLWAYPGNEAERYKDMNYWTELAHLLERGRFDAVFIGDMLGVFDVYQQKRDIAIRDALFFPNFDPSFLIPVMANVTKHLNFAITFSITYEHPYTLARKMTSLDHLTNGRVGWNMVASYLNSAARNFGLDEQLGHDERYDRGDEFLEVCYKLWEKSWEDDAVLRDPEKRIYTDPDKVHDIQHEGKYFKVPGIHLSEPSPQRTPVLFQAGTSERGRAFAARHAECIFLNPLSPEESRFVVEDTRGRTAKEGRDPNSVLFFPKLTPIVAETEEEAYAKYRCYLQYTRTEGTLALLSAWTGIDFSTFDQDELLAFIEKSKEGRTYLLDHFEKEKNWSVRKLSKFFAFGGLGALTIGTPQQIADKMEYFVDELGVDGFNIAYITKPQSLKDFIDLVVPELQRRGRVQKEYGEGTFREVLFEQNARLPQHHPGGKHRIQGGVSNG